MNPLHADIAAALQDAVRGRSAIVFATKTSDVAAWRHMLSAAGITERSVLPLDGPATPAPGQMLGVATQLAAQHECVRARAAHEIDMGRSPVLLVPDPLDPGLPAAHVVLGRKTPFARTAEDKMIVDSLWDAAGVPRVPSIICEPAHRLPALIAAVDAGDGVVINSQLRGGGPEAGGEGIRWLLPGSPPPATCIGADVRMRIMPLLRGLPCRIHGMAVNDDVVVFPPLELVSLPRPSTRTFFWAGAVPARTLAPGEREELDEIATAIGSWLGRQGHRGAFAADGVLTSDGFRPTELTTRLTSAFEGAAATHRVLLHAANLLARDGWTIDRYARLAELAATGLRGRVDLYGATATATTYGSHPMRWTLLGAMGAEGGDPVHGLLTLRPSPRGQLLHARLDPAALPNEVPMGVLAPHVYRLADSLFGTDFGELTAPFGLGNHPIPRQRPAESQTHARG